MGVLFGARAPWYRTLGSCAIALAVFGCKAGVTVDGSSADFNTSRGTVVHIRGAVRVPMALSATTSQKNLAEKKSFALDIAPTETTSVELMNSAGTILATTTVVHGTYFFSIDENAIADAHNNRYDTCFVRATTGDIVQIATLSVPNDSVTAVTADSAFEQSDITPRSTFATLMEYAGTPYNPLAATDGETPPDVRMATTSDLIDALVDRAAARLHTTSDLATLHSTMDDSLAALLATFRALDHIAIDGMRPSDAQYALMTLHDSTDPTALTLGNALRNSNLLSGIDARDLLAGATTLNALRDAVYAWRMNPAMTDALTNDPEAMRLFLGASITQKTVTQFQALHATSDAQNAALALLPHLHLGHLRAIDSNALTETFSAFLDPATVLAMTNDLNLQSTLESTIDTMFDTGFDPSVATLIAAAIAGNATDSAYWERFVHNGAIDVAQLHHLAALLHAEVESGTFAEVLSGEKKIAWHDFLHHIDLTHDWSAMASDAITAHCAPAFAAALGTRATNSCHDQCGGFTGTCACDDACNERGDCCADKVHECGENYLFTVMNQYGIDLRTTTFHATRADADSDDDSVPDLTDNCPLYRNADQRDTDNNGQGDACQDSDHDGAIDLYDNCVTTPNPDQMNTDYWRDRDGDACDLDLDGDNIVNADDNCPITFNPAQTDRDNNGVGDLCDGPDTDGDGWIDAFDNCGAIDNADQLNTDAWHDAIGDACDPDDDGDTIADSIDHCPRTYNPEQSDRDDNGIGDACDGSDRDADGILDAFDNCPLHWNPDQTDADRDRAGDACDADDDNDGIDDAHDNCRLVANADQSDGDRNSVGDACDGADHDLDGHPDVRDNCPTRSNPDQADANRNGVGDWCDATFIAAANDPSTADLDGDGVIGNRDNCPLIANVDQTDSDNDRIGDACASSMIVVSTSAVATSSSSTIAVATAPTTTSSPTSAATTPDASTPDEVNFAGHYRVISRGNCLGNPTTTIDNKGNEGNGGSIVIDDGDGACLYYSGITHTNADTCTYNTANNGTVTSITWDFTQRACHVMLMRE